MRTATVKYHLPSPLYETEKMECCRTRFGVDISKNGAIGNLMLLCFVRRSRTETRAFVISFWNLSPAQLQRRRSLSRRTGEVRYDFETLCIKLHVGLVKSWGVEGIVLDPNGAPF